jgi:hypothetical protein
MSGMSRAGTTGIVLLAVLGMGLLTRITNRAGVPPNNPAHSPVVLLPAIEGQPVTETVDLRNGNLHMEIPIRAARQKSTAPSSARRTE